MKRCFLCLLTMAHKAGGTSTCGMGKSEVFHAQRIHNSSHQSCTWHDGANRGNMFQGFSPVEELLSLNFGHMK